MTYVSINGHVIRANAKTGADDPPIRIAVRKNDRAPRYAHEIAIEGPSTLIYNGKCILNCGARLVIETAANVRIIR